MLIDTHCHLDAAAFDADRGAAVAAALREGVGLIVVPAVERANFAAVTSVCREFSVCRPAYGIHPMYVERAREEDLAALAETLASGEAVAVGEIGLDRFVEPRDEARQEYFFVEQLKLARRFDLPVLLHVRRAVDAVLAQLRRHRLRGGIAHAFNGSRQQADEFLRLGFKLGVGGTASFARASRVRTLVAELPAEAIVLETDAPDIPPAWSAGGRNAPMELARIAAVVAELRHTSLRELIDQTSANARTVLPRLAPETQHGLH